MPFVDYWQEFWDALQATVIAAWPDVEAGGVWQSTQSSQTSYGRARFPKAVLQMIPAREGEWGGHNQVWEQPIAFWYVARDPTGGDSIPFRSKLKALQDQIIGNFWLIDAPAPSVSRFQLLMWESFDVFEKNEGNVPFMSRDTGYLAGNNVGLFLVGDTPL